MGHGMDPRSSTLVYAVYRLAGGDPSASMVAFGAVAFAGWLGVLITALNLIPIGQLDGGHIAYALFGGRRAATLGAVLVGLLVAGGIFYEPHLLMWAGIVWFIAGLQHPPARNELAPLGQGRTILAWATLALFVAIVVPWPA
jgi:membrane-associated protease RseP (regulator of RpoE activity)